MPISPVWVCRAFQTSSSGVACRCDCKKGHQSQMMREGEREGERGGGGGSPKIKNSHTAKKTGEVRLGYLHRLEDCCLSWSVSRLGRRRYYTSLRAEVQQIIPMINRSHSCHGRRRRRHRHEHDTHVYGSRILKSNVKILIKTFLTTFGNQKVLCQLFTNMAYKKVLSRGSVNQSRCISNPSGKTQLGGQRALRRSPALAL